MRCRPGRGGWRSSPSSPWPPRGPRTCCRGRFWAEEGTHHFAYAATHGVVESVVWVYQRAGYVNLHANLATLVAARVPLDRAPTVTAWASFAVVCLLAWCALSWPSRLLTTGPARVVAAALLVLGPPALAEIWLTSLHAQVYLGLLTLLLAFVPTAALSRVRYVVGGALLALGGLSGLYSAALTPLFWWRAWHERSRRAIGYAGVLTVTTILQVVALLRSRASGRLSEDHTTLPSIEDVYRSVAGRQVGPLLLGRRDGDHDGFALLGLRGVVVGLLLLGVIVAIAVLVASIRERGPVLELLGAFVLVQALVQVGAISTPVGGRYAVVPMAALALVFVYGLGAAEGVVRAGAGLACAVMVVAGLTGFWSHQRSVLVGSGCPDWVDEVDRYEAGEVRRLQIWPCRPGAEWYVELPPR